VTDTRAQQNHLLQQHNSSIRFTFALKKAVSSDSFVASLLTSMSVTFDDSDHLLMFVIVPSFVVFGGLFLPRVQHSALLCGRDKLIFPLIMICWLFLLGVLVLCMLAAYGILPGDTASRVIIVIAVVIFFGVIVRSAGEVTSAALLLPVLLVFTVLFQAYINSFLVHSLGIPAWPSYVFYLLLVLAFVIGGLVWQKVISSDWITIPVYTALATILVIISINTLIIEFITPGTNLLACASADDGWQNTCPFQGGTYFPYILLGSWLIVLALCIWLERKRFYHAQNKHEHDIIKRQVNLRNSNHSKSDRDRAERSDEASLRMNEEAMPLVKTSISKWNGDSAPLPALHSSGLPILSYVSSNDASRREPSSRSYYSVSSASSYDDSKRE
jgi:hypothetical protein